MSDTKWTPGPWAFAGSGIVAETNYPNLEVVCLLERPPDEDFDRRRWMHNAHLIAAAPDLYEALEHAKKMLEEYETEATGESFNSLMINAALAKARGEEQNDGQDD